MSAESNLYLAKIEATGLGDPPIEATQIRKDTVKKPSVNS